MLQDLRLLLLLLGLLFGPALSSLLPFLSNVAFPILPHRQRTSRSSSSHCFQIQMAATNSKATPTIAGFEGTHVLITGASGGLGRSLALTLAQSSCSTLILSARNREKLESVASECRALMPSTSNDDVHVVVCDLEDPKSVQKLAKRAAEEYKVNVLINNGGISSRSRFVDTDIRVDEKLMQVNFLAGAALAKAVVPGMQQQGYGKIIWISSVQGLVGIPNRSSYAASKFAVQGYCESIRAELASSGISVHTVSPGYINTNLSQAAVTGDGSQYGVKDATTAAGADPDELAIEILQQVAVGAVDFSVATTPSAVAAVWMRLLCPWLLRSLLVKLYEKSQKEKKD